MANGEGNQENQSSVITESVINELRQMNNNKENTRERYTQIMGSLSNTVSSSIDRVKNVYTGTVDYFSSLSSKISEKFGDATQYISDGFSKISETFSSIANDILGPQMELIQEVSGLFSGIKSMFGGVFSAITGGGREEERQAESQEQTAESVSKLTREATTSGTIYTQLTDIPATLREWLSKIYSAMKQDDQTIRQLNESNQRNVQQMSSLTGYFEAEEKEEFRQGIGEQNIGSILADPGILAEMLVQSLGPVFTALGTALSATLTAVIGGALGGIAARVKAQFQAFYTAFVYPVQRFISGLRNLRFIQTIGTFLSEMRYVGNFLERVRSAFSYVGTFFTRIVDLFRYIGQWANIVTQGFVAAGQFGRILARVVQVFKFVATKLFLPINILLGLIDFIEGFTSTQGTLVEKIKAGLQEVVQGLIGFPVKLLGWVVDWLLGLVGVEIEGGVASHAMDIINRTVGLIIDYFLAPITAIRNFVQGFQTGEGNFLQKISNGIQQAITSIIRIPVSFIGWMINNIAGWFGYDLEATKVIMEKIKAFMDTLFAPIKWLAGAIGDMTTAVIDAAQFLGIIEGIKTTIISVFDLILSPFKIIWDSLQLLWNLLTGDFAGAAGELSQIFDEVKGMFVSLFNYITWPFRVFIYNPIKSLIDWFTSDAGGEVSIFDSLMNLASSFFSTIGTILKYSTPIGWVYMGIKKLWDLLSGQTEGGFISTVIDYVKWAFSGIQSLIMNYTPIGWLYTGIKSLWNLLTGQNENGFISTVIGYIQSIFSGFKSLILNYTPLGWLYTGMQQLWSWLTSGEEETSIIGEVMNKLKQIPSMIKDWIISMIPGAEMFTQAAGAVGDAAAGAWNTVTSWFGGGEEQGQQDQGGPRNSYRGGGIIPETGKYKLHEDEIVVPQKVSREILDSPGTGREATAQQGQQIENLKSYIQKQSEQINSLIQMYNNLSNTIQESIGNFQITQNQKTERVPQDAPPDEIEQIGILLNNKNWGVG